MHRRGLMSDIYSLKTIRTWLDYYEALSNGDKMPGSGGNSSPKANDGITTRQIIKIMLDSAIAKLPLKQQEAVELRWIKPVGKAKALEMLGITQKSYYQRCNNALNNIHLAVNGENIDFS